MALPPLECHTVVQNSFRSLLDTCLQRVLRYGFPVTWEWSLVIPLTLSVISFLFLASESCFLLVGIKDLFPTTEAEGVTSSFSLSLTVEAPQGVSRGLGWIINPSQQQCWTQYNGINCLGRQWSNQPVAAASTVIMAAAQVVSNQTVEVVWPVTSSIPEPPSVPFPKSEALDLLLIFWASWYPFDRFIFLLKLARAGLYHSQSIIYVGLP